MEPALPKDVILRILLETGSSDQAFYANKSYREMIGALRDLFAFPGYEEVQEYIQERGNDIGYWVTEDVVDESYDSVSKFGITGLDNSITVTSNPDGPIDDYSATAASPKVNLSDVNDFGGLCIDYSNVAAMLIGRIEITADNTRVVSSVIHEIISENIELVLDSGYNAPEVCYWIALNLEMLKGNQSNLQSVMDEASKMISEIRNITDSTERGEDSDEYTVHLRDRFSAVKRELSIFIASILEDLVD